MNAPLSPDALAAAPAGVSVPAALMAFPEAYEMPRAYPDPAQQRPKHSSLVLALEEHPEVLLTKARLLAEVIADPQTDPAWAAEAVDHVIGWACIHEGVEAVAAAVWGQGHSCAEDVLSDAKFLGGKEAGDEPDQQGRFVHDDDPYYVTPEWERWDEARAAGEDRACADWLVQARQVVAGVVTALERKVLVGWLARRAA